MLVHAGQEKDRLAAQAVITGQHVGQQGGVGVPDVGSVIHVIDGCGHVKHVGSSFKK